MVIKRFHSTASMCSVGVSQISVYFEIKRLSLCSHQIYFLRKKGMIINKLNKTKKAVLKYMLLLTLLAIVILKIFLAHIRIFWGKISNAYTQDFWEIILHGKCLYLTIFFYVDELYRRAGIEVSSNDYTTM